jgi:hypothetical protein
LARGGMPSRSIGGTNPSPPRSPRGQPDGCVIEAR